ncbi:hypothetical protein [Proteus sp. FZP2095]|uniref:hypothetical protein n=1 Tax=Proteus sp. FZP2095 TaxID=2950158 RepID=UPI00203396E7|nr:hypothetical protein [Proteus sp. FZP2095]MCM2366644.1 hypothetical protein [Proteus sp. FZP2095]
MIKNSGKFNGAGLKALEARIRAMGKKKVVVGVPAATNNLREGELSNAMIAAVHEFGATINHPGGTSYGYRTEKDARDGKSRFLRNGQGYMETGKTGAHKIKIPERSFLRSTFNEQKENWSKLIIKGFHHQLANNGDINSVLGSVGGVMMGDVQRKIESGISPANAPSTVRKKKSSKTLMDSGALKSSITYEVRDK